MEKRKTVDSLKANKEKREEVCRKSGDRKLVKSRNATTTRPLTFTQCDDEVTAKSPRVKSTVGGA